MSTIITNMTTVFNVVIQVFSDVLNAITSTPILIVPVILSIFGGIVLFSIKKIRSMGLKGGGKKRRYR